MLSYVVGAGVMMLCVCLGVPLLAHYNFTANLVAIPTNTSAVPEVAYSGILQFILSLLPKDEAISLNT